jgi:beta-lactamase regulating signal transducer with metallopeptidase domain
MTHIDFAMTPLLNGVWQGAILAGIMALLLALVPRWNAMTRFTMLWVTLVAVVALPAGRLASSTSIQGTQAGLLGPPATAASAPAALSAFETRRSLWHPGPVPQSRPQSVSKRGPESGAELANARQSAALNPSAVMAALEHPLIQIHSRRLLIAFEITWALLSLLMLARLGLGCLELRRLKLSAMPAPDGWQARLMGLCTRNRIRRKAQLLVSGEIAAPMSLGFRNPAILIPRALFDTLSDSELAHVLMHELAHLRRRDDWTNLAEKIIEILLPVQPALQWIGRRMSLEREIACDDWVIATTGMAKPYAASLTRVAELSLYGRAGILAAGATGNRSQLFRRVHHMLNEKPAGRPKLAFFPLGAATAVVITLMYLGAQTPQVMAFTPTSAVESRPQAPSIPAVPPEAPHPPDAPSPRLIEFLPRAGAEQTPTASPTSSEPEMPQAPASEVTPSEPPAPVAPMSPVAPEQSAQTHTETITSNGWTSLRVSVDGTVEFTDDDRDIKSLSPNGHFRLEEGSWFSRRAFDVTADSAGKLTRTYSVGWTAKPMDDEGRRWLGAVLPQVIRDSGIGAGPRVARILRQGGPEAVLNEIGLIHSSGSRRIYVEELFSQTTLNAAQLKRAASLIQEISSDGDKAQVLIAEDARYFTSELRPYLFHAAETISSDGDKRRVLSDFVIKDRASTETLVSASRAARQISSDGDKADVLIEIADPYRAGSELRAAYFDAANSIASDGDHARVLLKLLSAHGDDRDTLVRVLESAKRISSDGDKARVLEQAVSRYLEDEPVEQAFFDAANSISSDGDHQRALVALVERRANGVTTLRGIANSAERISSDGDKARVLTELAGANLESIRDPFFTAANSIHSDGDHSRVLLAVLDNPLASGATAVAAIESATLISSDGDMARVLLDAAERYPKDPNVNSALRKAVAALHSDGDYRAVMSEIARHEGSS